MFNKDFYPTDPNTIATMLEGVQINGKVFLEPEGGKGDIVDFLNLNGAKAVLACEINEDLCKILESKCTVIGNDFLKITSDQISHVQHIVMNPPFSADEKHILHAYEIAPAGCKITALCNLNTVTNSFSSYRKQLAQIIEQNGSYEDLGACFTNSEHSTEVKIALIKIQKAGASYGSEFEGFFMDEEIEDQQNAVMSYNLIRDLVNRYVGAIKIFDEQLEAAVKLNALTSGFYSSNIAINLSNDQKPIKRAEFKKEMQKCGWKFIFNKLNMGKYATKGLRDDINKFVETQTEVPFTMRNIYKMLEIIVGTQGQRMDKAMLEVFDKLTMHYHENRYNVEGWKTNSHYLMGEKFIIPNMCSTDKWHSGDLVNSNYGRNFGTIEDFLKALCYLTGDSYDSFNTLDSTISNPYLVTYEGKTELFIKDLHYGGAFERINNLRKSGIEAKCEYKPTFYGKTFEWSYFEVKAFKKGTMHFKFKSPDLWARFNQRIAKIKGYPLYENVKKEAPYKENVRKQHFENETYKPIVLGVYRVSA